MTAGEAPGGGPDDAGPGAQRLDKWLWFARLAKSRTLASGAVAEGKVKVNRVTVTKPSHALKLGDVVTTRLTRDIRVLKVAGLGTRRGPAAEARLLYEDLTPPRPPRPEHVAAAWAEREAGSGRPTKRDRRRTDAFKADG